MDLLRRSLLAAGLACALVLPAAAQAQAARPAPRVALETSEGRIVIELDAQAAPRSSANFLQYVNEHFYDGTIFHRVINGFMIQGGGFDEKMTQKPTHAPIANESTNGLKNARGSIAMARTSDPNSATAQFFINVVDNNNLDYPSFDGHGYAVFGRVVEGMEVVDRIRAVPTTNAGPFQNVPAKAVVIKSAAVLK